MKVPLCPVAPDRDVAGFLPNELDTNTLDAADELAPTKAFAEGYKRFNDESPIVEGRPVEVDDGTPLWSSSIFEAS